MTPDESAPPAAFAARTTVEQVEEGLALAPRFDADGLIPCITTDAETGDVLILGYMNGEALRRARRRSHPRGARARRLRPRLCAALAPGAPASQSRAEESP